MAVISVTTDCGSTPASAILGHFSVNADDLASRTVMIPAEGILAEPPGVPARTILDSELKYCPSATQ